MVHTEGCAYKLGSTSRVHKGQAMFRAHAKLQLKEKTEVGEPCILNQGPCGFFDQYLNTSTGLHQWSMGFYRISYA